MLALILVGVYDAGYLTIEHYRDVIPPCSTSVFADCGRVLQSEYAVLFGVPLALLGLIHYMVLGFVFVVVLLFTSYKDVIARQIRPSAETTKQSQILMESNLNYWLLIQTSGGLLFSLYLVYLQLFVIHAICLYCMLSALVSTLLFVLAQFYYFGERKFLFVTVFAFVYRTAIKPTLFLMDPEFIHLLMVRFGELIGKAPPLQVTTRYLTTYDQPMLTQHIEGIAFDHPVGLAAGFDYEGWLTQTLAPWGFGWQTVGTITNSAYEGNVRPMLGRLPQSRSLMVNKGFKNRGADATIGKLGKLKHHTDLGGLCDSIPYGISIGRTNSLTLATQKESVADIVSAFTKFEQSPLSHAYYELNISCPNLKGDIEFYTPTHLEELLIAIESLNIKRPIFVKMPIEKSDTEVASMLAVVARHSPKGVIFGNLQKDRNHPSLVPGEVAKYPKGNFSGKPTFQRSNELIKLAYREYKGRLVIIGCGGIFSAEDAYTKIKLGASLVQLITGMIYEGPQLIAQINMGLEALLQKDGYKNIADAVGRDT